jgi:hypothetical protein
MAICPHNPQLSGETSWMLRAGETPDAAIKVGTTIEI